MKSGDKARQYGLTVKEMSEITSRASSTLNDMFHKYPKCFEVLAIGCRVIKWSNNNDTATNDSKNERSERGY